MRNLASSSERHHQSAGVFDWVPAGRTLHLLDLENLCGDPGAGPETIAGVIAAYQRQVRIAARDHVVIATNRRQAFAAKAYLPGACVRIGRGVDGADYELLAECDPHDAARRFSRVIIGSGDHIFATLAAELTRRMVVVGVVSRQRSLSADLQRNASFRRILQDLNTPISVAMSAAAVDQQWVGAVAA